MRVKLKQSDYNAMIVYARQNLPNEACGLLAGHQTETEIVVEKVFCLTNADASPEHFSMHPQEQLQAVKEMRRLGLSPLGNFHSHPQTPARPSQEDIRLAYDSSAVYMILSLAQKEPVLKAFEIQSGSVVVHTLEMIDA